MADLIRVRVGKESNHVVLWERNPEHPQGEIFIDGQSKDVHEIARTSAVMQRIQSGDLVIVEDEAEPEPDQEPSGGIFTANGPTDLLIGDQVDSDETVTVEDEPEPEAETEPEPAITIEDIEDIGETAEKLNEVLTPKSEKTTRRK